MPSLGVPGFNTDNLSYTDIRRNVLPVVDAPRRPTVNDKKYALFTFWRTNKKFSGTEGEIWVLIRFESNGDATWVQVQGAVGTGLQGLKDDANAIATGDGDDTVKLTGTNNITVTKTATSVLTIGLTGNIPPLQKTQVDVATGGGVNPVVPDANGLITVTATDVAAHGSPIETITRAANAWNIEAQRAIDETVPANSNNIGMSSFDSAAFTVNANGWVQLIGGGTPTIDFDVDAATPPGTDPVVPDGTGTVGIFGSLVAAQAIPIRTHSTAANQFEVELQIASAQASSTLSANGASHYDSAAFAVDADGFVTLLGGGQALESITGDDSNPVTPDANGNIDLFGEIVANSTNAKPLFFARDAVNTDEMEAQLQLSTASATTNDENLAGICYFDTSQFTVNSSGFVQTTVGGGNWTLIKTVPVSGLSQVNFDSTDLSTTYNKFKITWAASGGSTVLEMRASTDNGSTFRTCNSNITSGGGSGGTGTTVTIGDFVSVEHWGAMEWESFTFNRLTVFYIVHTLFNMTDRQTRVVMADAGGANRFNYIRIQQGSGTWSSGNLFLYGK